MWPPDWTWDVGGLQFEAGSTIAVSFDAPGAKLVAAAHQTCPAPGNKMLSILTNDIFTDGFESGDISTWSETVAQGASVH
jgi:hypothetical protein